MSRPTNWKCKSAQTILDTFFWRISFCQCWKKVRRPELLRFRGNYWLILYGFSLFVRVNWSQTVHSYTIRFCLSVNFKWGASIRSNQSWGFAIREFVYTMGSLWPKQISQYSDEPVCLFSIGRCINSSWFFNEIVLFINRELAKRLEGTGVTSNSRKCAVC